MIRIRADIPVDLTGYVYSLTADAVRHIIKKHGSEQERLQGQEPVSYLDFLHLVEITAAPDFIKSAGATKQGRSLLQFTKQIGRFQIDAMIEVQTGRRRLMLVTMYKKAGRLDNQAAPPQKPV